VAARMEMFFYIVGQMCAEMGTFQQAAVLTAWGCHHEN